MTDPLQDLMDKELLEELKKIRDNLDNVDYRIADNCWEVQEAYGKLDELIALLEDEIHD